MSCDSKLKHLKFEFGRPAIASAISDSELTLVNEETLRCLDLIELRVDHFKETSERHIKEIFHKVRYFNRPLIATIRSYNEGGQRFIPDVERLKLFQIVTKFADIVDIEMQSEIFQEVKDLVNLNSKILIASYHNFENTPAYDELTGLVKRCKEKGSDIVKIAAKALDMDDIRVMTRLTLDFCHEGIVTISMGNKGLLSRVFFPIIGSLFTFAFIGSSKAPGQVSVVELRRYMDSLVG